MAAIFLLVVIPQVGGSSMCYLIILSRFLLCGFMVLSSVEIGKLYIYRLKKKKKIYIYIKMYIIYFLIIPILYWSGRTIIVLFEGLLL